VIAESGRRVSTPIATIQQASAEAEAGQCSSCRKPRPQVAAMASAGDARICDECLETVPDHSDMRPCLMESGNR